MPLMAAVAALVAAVAGLVPRGLDEGSPAADDHHEALAAGDGGVEEVALEQHPMLGVER